MDKNPSIKQKNKEGGIGPIVGALIIVIVLLIAAIYYWGQHLNFMEEQRQLQAAQEAAFQASVAGKSMSTRSDLGTSTNISDIEKDLDGVK